ncbi:CPK1, partial [Symbiodinium sp. CCMP2456]
FPELLRGVGACRGHRGDGLHAEFLRSREQRFRGRRKSTGTFLLWLPLVQHFQLSGPGQSNALRNSSPISRQLP